MTWYRRLLGLPEKRAVTVPWNIDGPLTNTPAATEARAITLAPVFAAVRCIAMETSTLPLCAYRGEDGSTKITMPLLFRRLSAEGRLIGWLQQALYSLVLHGNAVGYIDEWDGLGYPVSITWVPMNKVRVAEGSWWIDGKPVDGSRIVHITWLAVPGQTLGMSPLEAYAATVGAGLNAQTYAADDGGMPPVVFKNGARTVDPDEATAVRQRLAASMRRREPLVTGSDWDFSPISIPPNQAQFIETQKLAATQIANIYGLPPGKVGGEAGGSLTYNTVEMESLDLRGSLRSYAEILEHAFASWLPSEQYVKFELDALVRADLMTRMQAYEVQYRIGLRNRNELRGLENLPPVEGGDTYPPVAPAPTATAIPPSRHLSLINEQEQT